MRFKDKVVVVTGGASGLGLASAKSFAREGGKVAIFDVDEKTGKKAVSEIEQDGGKAIFVFCDVTKPELVEEAYATVINKWGRVDVLHGNAGIINEPITIDKMPYEEWKKLMDINLNGMFLAAKGAITQMLKQDGGTIVFTGSNWAYVSDPGFIGYSASKAAVVALGRVLALDHAKDNIRVNVACPGNMITPLLERQLSQEPDPEATLESMGQISTPQEVANLILFLASDESSAMKGSAVIIDQGETLGYGKGLRVQKGK